MNPYLVDLPAVVSFSGGRTSGFMLRHILDAHGGQPEELLVCFQNTGLEHPKTYEFVRECEDQWQVDIHWLEYTVEDGKHSFCEVGYETASRNGEPFEELVRKKRYLPNPVARICTTNLKMRTLYRFLETKEAFKDGFINCIGLRYDEPRRVARMKGDRAAEEPYCPMFHAKHTEEDVLRWWEQQTFDLNLPLTGNMAGNCVGCFLKSRAGLETLMLEMPEHFDWWIRMEETLESSAESGAKFRNDRLSYAHMAALVKSQGSLFPEENDTLPCMCTD